MNNFKLDKIMYIKYGCLVQIKNIKKLAGYNEKSAQTWSERKNKRTTN